MGPGEVASGAVLCPAIAPGVGPIADYDSADTDASVYCCERTRSIDNVGNAPFPEA